VEQKLSKCCKSVLKCSDLWPRRARRSAHAAGKEVAVIKNTQRDALHNAILCCHNAVYTITKPSDAVTMSCAAVEGTVGGVYLQALRPRAHHRLTVGALVSVDLFIRGYIVRCVGASSLLVALAKKVANELHREWNRHLDDRRLLWAGG
jgi:hypothetical protein